MIFPTFQNIMLESGDPRSPVYPLYRELQFLLVSKNEKFQFQTYMNWWCVCVNNLLYLRLNTVSQRYLKVFRINLEFGFKNL